MNWRKCGRCFGLREDWKNWTSLCEKCYDYLYDCKEDPTGTATIPLKPDLINTPPHYTKGWIEPIDYTISNKLDFCEGNVIKYVTRYKYKNWLEDLKKARFYLNKLIEQYDNKES